MNSVTGVSLQWFPLLPIGLVLTLAAALLGVLAFGSWLLLRKSVPPRWVWCLGMLRVGMVVLFTLGLLRPVISFPRQVAETPDVLVLIDRSASMHQPSAAGNGTRWDEVRRALLDSPALRSAAGQNRLHWFAFDRRAHAIDAESLDDDSSMGAAPNGDGTNLADSLRSAYEHARLLNATTGAGGAPVRALLISDGQDQGANDAASVAKQLGLTVDVWAPRAGDAGATETASLVDASHAPRVLLESETAIQATVRAAADTDGLALVMEEDGREVERQPVGPLRAGEEARIVTAHRPQEAGPKRYTLRLMRGDSAVGRPRAVNVRVVDRAHEVLLLEDTWRWEFKYLRRLLEDDPNFTCTALLSRGGAAFVQFAEPERGVELGGFPRARRDLAGFDTLILGNVDPRAWPRGLARHLHDAVVEDGKSLVVIAGPRLGDWTDQIDLTRLLPVEINRDSSAPVSGPIELRATPEGEAAGWFALAPPGSADGGGPVTVSRLPPVERVYPVIRKQPAATVLLEAANRDNPNGPLIVMAEHTVGHGRVLFIGSDDLWRWQTLGPRANSGATLHTTFWQHALRALAPPEPTSSSVRLALRPARTAYRQGERVRLSTQLQADPALSSAAPAVEIAAIVTLPDGRRLPLDLTADPRDPRRFLAEFDAVAPGHCAIEAVARAEGQVLSESTAQIEVEPGGAERDPAPVNAAGLARLAAATGGRVIDLAAADGWLPTTDGSTTMVERRQTIDAWQSFAMLLMLCVLLAGDWTLRMFWGYV